MAAGKLFLLLLSVVAFRLSWACVAMKPKDFDDVMPLTRIPPTNPLWTTEAMPTTAEMNEETTSSMDTTSATSTSTSTASTTSTTTTRDPCDMCMVPIEFPISDNSPPCGLITDPSLPSIMISALPNGMNCELVVTGCFDYQMTTDIGNCDFGPLSPNVICQNGVFASPTFGEAITKIRCNII